MRILVACTVAALSLSTGAARQSAPQAPAAAELEYDVYCKKEQSEKRKLFRAATADQKAVIAKWQADRPRQGVVRGDWSDDLKFGCRDGRMA